MENGKNKNAKIHVKIPKTIFLKTMKTRAELKKRNTGKPERESCASENKNNMENKIYNKKTVEKIWSLFKGQSLFRIETRNFVKKP